MNSNYVAEIQSIQVYRTSNLYPSTYMYPDTSRSSGIHVSGLHVWCKHGIKAIILFRFSTEHDQPHS